MLDKISEIYVFWIVNSFTFIKVHFAMPYDFCYPDLNTSDCDVEPTPVFTYYKPGSRCEIELWRGCPTMNKFANEYECSHYCIGRLTASFSAENYNEISHEAHDKNQCQIPIDLDNCGEAGTEVYTFNFNEATCEKVTWKGCDTVNKFDDEDSCLDACREFHKEEDVGQSTEDKSAGDGGTASGEDADTDSKSAEKALSGNDSQTLLKHKQHKEVIKAVTTAPIIITTTPESEITTEREGTPEEYEIV